MAMCIAALLNWLFYLHQGGEVQKQLTVASFLNQSIGEKNQTILHLFGPVSFIGYHGLHFFNPVAKIVNLSTDLIFNIAIRSSRG